MIHLVSILLFLVISIAHANSFEQDLTVAKAEQLYKAGDKDAAKDLYIQAASLGSSQAHFALAYYYRLPSEQYVYHLVAAARQGHKQALELALERLSLGDNLARVNPQQAIELYLQAKKANPQLKLYEEEELVESLKMSAEPGPFDVQNFCEKYQVKPFNEHQDYYVWALAEQASRGRFGDHDPKLVLQLVARGGHARAELESAVKKAYDNWKKGVVTEFNICDHITSGFGLGFCAARVSEQEQKQINLKIQSIAEKLDTPTKNLLSEAYNAASKFIAYKASHEEGHGGTGRSAWIIYSEMEQKHAYIELIEKVLQEFKPNLKHDFTDADHQLNVTYKKLINKLKTKKDKLFFDMATYEDVRNTQRLWLIYRDATSKLFSQLNPTVGNEIWKGYLTEIREQELLNILKST